jgi:site-specific DNA recombinase
MARGASLVGSPELVSVAVVVTGVLVFLLRLLHDRRVSDLIENGVLALLADSERMVKVWEPGSDSANELAELDELLADLTDQLSTGQFKRGTPQRQRLDERIRLLADKRAELASRPSKPSGWHWVSTGEMFDPWWVEQTNEARNAWLRSAGVRVEFDREQILIEYGELETKLRELSAGDGRKMKELFKAMSDNNIQVMIVGTDGAVHITPKEA